MAEYLANLSNGQIDEKGIYRLFGTLLTQSGVVQSGALSVAAQGTPDMTVKVAGGATGHDIVFITASGDTYHGWNTADYNVTISSNATGVTKKDAIVAYADLAAGISTSNNPGALKFVAVRGSGTDTAPDNTQITASAVGSNPYVVLAHVSVSNGASSINSGNITDQRPLAQVEADRLEALSASKISTIPIVEQNDTSNTSKASKILTGWGQILVDNTTQLSEAVTFGSAFASAPVVVVSSLGVKATTAATSNTQFSNPGSQKNISAGTIAVSTTGFTASLTVGGTLAETNQRLAGGFYWGYSWIAIGEAA